MNMPPMEWMEKVVRLDSVTHQSNEALVRFLIPLLEETGLKVKLQTVKEKGTTFFNLFGFSHSPSTRPLLALNTHLDTVPAGDKAHWTMTENDPFRLTRRGDKLYGLGSADVKLDFLCKILAAREAKPWNRPFVLVGSYGEERGLIGAAKLLKTKQIQPKFALVGEPSNLELIYAHKGHMGCVVSLPLKGKMSDPAAKLVWKGTAAHSSTPHLGVNAIYRAIAEIKKRKLGILSLQGGSAFNVIPEKCEAAVVEAQNEATVRLIAFFELLQGWNASLERSKDKRFTPAVTTVSVNLARTEKGRVSLTFDVRVLPATRTDALKQKIESIAREVGARIDDLTIDVPLQGSKDSRFIKAAAKALTICGVKPVKATKASSTEAALYSQAGAEAIVFGPGVSVGNVHKPNEHNLVSQIEVATQFYTEMLKMPLGAY